MKTKTETAIGEQKVAENGNEILLDFTGLFSTAQKPVYSPTEPLLAENEYKTISKNKKPPESPEKPVKEEQATELYLQTQKAKRVMKDIADGAREAENTKTLFLQAIEVISILMKDGGAFERTVKENMEFVTDEALEAAHKAGLDYFTEPKKAELAAIDQRIKRLSEEQATASGQDKERKQKAIERHQKLKELFYKPQL